MGLTCEGMVENTFVYCMMMVGDKLNLIQGI